MLSYIPSNAVGAPPTNIMVTPISLTQLRVSWTAPSPAPSDGYRITVNSTDTNIVRTSQQSPLIISLPQPGVYSVRVVALYSGKLPSEAVGVNATVRGIVNRQVLNILLFTLFTTGGVPPVISTTSPTATSVTITWTQPVTEFSLPVLDYTVSLTRVTGSGQVLCPSVMDSRGPVTTTATVTSMEFTGLQEYSNYIATVTARFSVTSTTFPTAINFTTLSTGM